MIGVVDGGSGDGGGDDVGGPYDRVDGWKGESWYWCAGGIR